MADLTEPPDIDDILRRLVEQPSYAAQILTVAARLLELDIFTPLTPWSLDQAVTGAEKAILHTLPESVQHIASTRARNHLPYPYAGTRREYADRLHAAAKEIA
jgi:hypothetical protein